jgi:D-serine deaminase-like pyridoxal phosphate-dependent protein
MSANAPTGADTGSALGLDRLPTPALLLDRRILQRNIERMTQALGDGVALRPHVKSHKCLEIARMQIAAGAIGVTTATVWEALAMAEGGIEDILIANLVVGSEKLALLGEIAARSRVTVAVDDPRNAAAISDMATAAGCELEVLIDIDVGLGRTGVRSIKEGVALAEAIATLDGLSIRGVMGYEGHVVHKVDPVQRTQMASEVNRTVLGLAAALRERGIPVEVVSGGGTGTFDLTGRCAGYTELQAGSYVFMDATYEKVVTEFEPGLTVLATVASRKGNTVVIDCGEKTVAEADPPRLRDHATLGFRQSEEHYVIEVPADNQLDLGDRVHVIPGHCCGTVNLHSRYYVVEDGAVVDMWPVLARGAGR